MDVRYAPTGIASVASGVLSASMTFCGVAPSLSTSSRSPAIAERGEHGEPRLFAQAGVLVGAAQDVVAELFVGHRCRP